MMYRIDVYTQKNNTKKKAFSAWYPTEVEASAAGKAIASIRKGVYCQSWRENGPVTRKILGGWTCSNPIKDDRF